ncbi:hypothetical protein CEUSTIGMA_g10911.t1 [Chlamydomonas eustigma]|uniref:Protein kinase domain-containing protein n=1 Tax=Chlamydomonas eustigma TaxID=1157962 RepID=A0A250XKE1_9CHLO|nr:hypothetical protein CEUSTIGMA_g10911.t1 [Chlamydomonas eustigma]|eukprot:GAX83486.1 hypothetical protein CEUSTIGMA_g10911.t1 [Chlamydomonas eustigma]
MIYVVCSSDVSHVLSAVTGRAPEMFQGRYDEKVDVYSFGAMVTGHAPWSQQLSQKDAIIPILYHNYFNPNPECRRFLRDFVPSEVDTEIRELIVACLDPLPEERPTFQNVLLRLEGFSDRVKIRLR